MLTLPTVMGLLTALLLVALTGVYAGKKVKNAGDFTGGSKMGAAMIA